MKNKKANHVIISSDNGVIKFRDISELNVKDIDLLIVLFKKDLLRVAYF